MISVDSLLNTHTTPLNISQQPVDKNTLSDFAISELFVMKLFVYPIPLIELPPFPN